MYNQYISLEPPSQIPGWERCEALSEAKILFKISILRRCQLDTLQYLGLQSQNKMRERSKISLRVNFVTRLAKPRASA